MIAVGSESQVRLAEARCRTSVGTAAPVRGIVHRLNVPLLGPLFVGQPAVRPATHQSAPCIMSPFGSAACSSPVCKSRRINRGAVPRAAAKIIDFPPGTRMPSISVNASSWVTRVSVPRSRSNDQMSKVPVAGSVRLASTARPSPPMRTSR